jgi:DNA-binding CsgD family transcriptional regulator
MNLQTSRKTIIFLSQFTVDTHRKNLLARLNVRNTASLIRLAVEQKLI